jgi:hypothetical protein
MLLKSVPRTSFAACIVSPASTLDRVPPSGIETDINEVLQIQSVFLNVSKALLAPRDALVAAFGTDDQAACALVILEKGELEVSDKERAQVYETLFRDVAATVAAACVNPDSQRPYPVTIIEKVCRWRGRGAHGVLLWHCCASLLCVQHAH